MFKDGFIKLLLFGLSYFARFLFFLFRFRFSSQCYPLAEAVNVSRRVNQFLFAGIKWVAITAYFRRNSWRSRPCSEFIAAGAAYNSIGMVSGMNSGFHKGFLSLYIWYYKIVCLFRQGLLNKSKM